MSDELRELTEAVRSFIDDREWQHFHTPKNLAMAIASEAGELLALYRWNERANDEKVASEIADIMIFLLSLCDQLGLDLYSDLLEKMEQNELKYPVEKYRGLKEWPS